MTQICNTLPYKRIINHLVVFGSFVAEVVIMFGQVRVHLAKEGEVVGITWPQTLLIQQGDYTLKEK